MASGELKDDHLVDSETVFRRVLSDRGHWDVLSDGALKASTTAFTDPDEEPSVDRSKLCGPAGAKHTQQGNPRNGVLRLGVGTIRNLSPLHLGGAKPNDPGTDHDVDVVSRPLDENPPHCVVCLNPAKRNKALFKRMREGLARIAEFEIVPD